MRIDRQMESEAETDRHSDRYHDRYKDRQTDVWSQIQRGVERFTDALQIEAEKQKCGQTDRWSRSKDAKTQ